MSKPFKRSSHLCKPEVERFELFERIELFRMEQKPIELATKRLRPALPADRSF
jgi:hypothetical protein